MKDLKLNHTYLLQFGSGDVLSSITILMITDKAYHIQWNNDDKNSTWEQKKVFNRNYNVVEDITDFMKDELKENLMEYTNEVKKKLIEYSKRNLITCPICHGMGTVPDEKSTAGTTTCPLCNGSKMIPESVGI